MDSVAEKVQYHDLSIIADDRGDIMHMMRRDSPWFEDFGEVYFSKINHRAVKAWKRHQQMTQNLVVPMGQIKLVTYDAAIHEVDEVILGTNAYQLVVIPPMIWYGFQGLADPESLIVNCADLPHSATEVDRLPIDNVTIPYNFT